MSKLLGLSKGKGRPARGSPSTPVPLNIPLNIVPTTSNNDVFPLIQAMSNKIMKLEAQVAQLPTKADVENGNRRLLVDMKKLYHGNEKLNLGPVLHEVTGRLFSQYKYIEDVPNTYEQVLTATLENVRKKPGVDEARLIEVAQEKDIQTIVGTKWSNARSKLSNSTRTISRGAISKTDISQDLVGKVFGIYSKGMPGVPHIKLSEDEKREWEEELCKNFETDLQGVFHILVQAYYKVEEPVDLTVSDQAFIALVICCLLKATRISNTQSHAMFKKFEYMLLTNDDDDDVDIFEPFNSTKVDDLDVEDEGEDENDTYSTGQKRKKRTTKDKKKPKSSVEIDEEGDDEPLEESSDAVKKKKTTKQKEKEASEKAKREKEEKEKAKKEKEEKEKAKKEKEEKEKAKKAQEEKEKAKKAQEEKEKAKKAQEEKEQEEKEEKEKEEKEKEEKEKEEKEKEEKEKEEKEKEEKEKEKKEKAKKDKEDKEKAKKEKEEKEKAKKKKEEKEKAKKEKEEKQKEAKEKEEKEKAEKAAENPKGTTTENEKKRKAATEEDGGLEPKRPRETRSKTRLLQLLAPSNKNEE